MVLEMVLGDGRWEMWEMGDGERRGKEGREEEKRGGRGKGEGREIRPVKSNPNPHHITSIQPSALSLF